ncbi:MAG TPA: DUF192 domain-containing protein [Thermoanaerobaculia bacterium]|nr:DUF192 domain-containing protein [Thermoanaerobaculia bacterium]
MRIREVAMLSAWLLLAAACGVRPSGSSPSDPVDPSAPQVVLPDGSTVGVEIAADPETRARGLMYRPSLPPGRGMLFLFPETSVHSFWMKDTLVSLDMIWIDEQGRVVDVESEVPPCRSDPCPSYVPDGESRYVLELAAGEAARHGISPGVTLGFRNLERFAVR